MTHDRTITVPQITRPILPIVLLCVAACPKASPPNVDPTQSESIDFTLGPAASVRIRGPTEVSATQEPLYIVDGLVVGRHDTSGFRLQQLNSVDIESIEVIKGTTATNIYGSNAVHGVVVIVSNPRLDAPSVSEFPEPTLRFRVAGNRELVRAYLESRLREERIPWNNRVEDPLFFVITLLMPEARLPNVNRDRRASVLLRLNQEFGTTCSNVGLSWLRKTKGDHERTWRASEEDQQQGVPSIVGTIAEWLESDSLARGCE